jgi:1-acyl-sn-glycerol-3-phosphate acyltransferase
VHPLTIVPTLATTIEPPPTRGPCFLVFPSGTRSRDGVTQGPVRTGFLRALWSAARSAGVDDVHLVPVGITYDRRVDDDALFGEPNEVGGHSGSLGKVFRWAGRALLSRGSLGNIVIRAGDPLLFSIADDTPPETFTRIASRLHTSIVGTMDVPASVLSRALPS